MIAWLHQIGQGITPQAAFVGVVIGCIAGAVVWLGQECEMLGRRVERLGTRVSKLEAGHERLTKRVNGVGWRDSMLLTQFDWRVPKE